MSDNPIFFIGMPRSGTTVVFEAFARSSTLGWLSNYTEMWPRWPVANMACPLLDNRLINLRGNKKQYGKVVFGNRYLPQPVEAYNFWDYYTRRDFSRDYLLDMKASDEEAARVRAAVSKVLCYQMKQRLVTKLTGPGRISYLASVFPNATFINIVRDGRAVVHSLMNVGFWKEKGGFDAPFWDGGLNDQELAIWHKKKGAAVLCALQWEKIMQSTLHEQSQLGKSRYLVVRYEDYVADPKRQLQQISEITDCPYEESSAVSIGDGASIINMNEKYKKSFSPDTISIITEIMQPMLNEYDYVEK